ncbi:hypothetical protein CRUP_035187, partial [Coryphaenoides rupestris]
RVPRSCGTCDLSACAALPADGCAAGTAPDACGCCVVCNAAEGEPCGGRGLTARRCAAGLECVKSDKDKKSKAGGVCACKANYEVCGGDGVTYKTGCELKAASARAVADGQPGVKVQNKGRCATDVYNVSGSQVYLSCEAIGVPTPVVTWKKISPLSEDEAGSYECHAANSKGDTSATATIHVVESLDDVPVKKVNKDEEL